MHAPAPARTIERLEAPSLADCGVAHGFFGRAGGASTGIYAGLNVGFGSDDDRDAVSENRRRAMAALADEASPLVTVHQVHGTDVVRVETPWPRAENPKADGLVTDRPGLALGILTADCTPILLVDPEAGVIGAAHSGWKGAVAGIGPATVAAMERLGAQAARIRAAIGPTINQASYEVGPEFFERFEREHPASVRFFQPAAAPGKHLFDLPGFVEAHLSSLGLAAVDCSQAVDTCADEARFFSYRRATLRGEPDYGRQLAAVMLRG
ncbi:MAG: peptidoglycan editing factor PgeF [Marivibrio sp.]|uniref:peptidoglycan editing factor PgeF n=1 Tax=Marivibrio sp. TaxID=2039719 RepID=UPI0032ED8BC7